MKHALTRAIGVAALATLALAGCSTAAPTEPTTPAEAGGMAPSGLITQERCDANAAAGKVTFLTSYMYLASVGIADVVTAKDLGYFEDLCIDLEIMPGDTATNAQVTSAGQAQIAGYGGPSEVLQARAQDADIVSIATYGNTSAIQLITLADGPIDDLKSLEGKTLGYKGQFALEIRTMLAGAGVDVSKVDAIQVGYDPLILPQGQVDALTVYKSNEPWALRAQGYEVNEWDPVEFGAVSGFNSQIANATFAAEHPTVIEDFLRASFRALEWIGESEENLEHTIDLLEDASQSGFNRELSTKRVQIELGLVADSQPEGTPTGLNVPELWAEMTEGLVADGILPDDLDVETAYDNSFVEAIFDGTVLIWGPAE